MTATTVTPATVATIHEGAIVPPARGLIHDSWVIAKRGLLHMKRQPEALSDATIQPVMFVLLFAYVFGGVNPVPGGNCREYLMGGIFAQTIVFTAFGVALSLANDRKNNAVDRFRSLPIAKGAVLSGHAIANLIKSLLPIVLMSLVGLVVGWRIRTDIVDAALGYLLLIAFAFAMIWIGVLLGSLVATQKVCHRHCVRRVVPTDVCGQHVRAALPSRRRRQTRKHDAWRAASSRRMEPGHHPVQRRPHPVRQPGRGPEA